MAGINRFLSSWTLIQTNTVLLFWTKKMKTNNIYDKWLINYQYDIEYAVFKTTNKKL